MLFIPPSTLQKLPPEARDAYALMERVAAANKEENSISYAEVREGIEKYLTSKLSEDMAWLAEKERHTAHRDL